MSIKQYRKKPIVVEVIQYDGTNFDEIAEWSGGIVEYYNILTKETNLEIHTLEGIMSAIKGSYIVKGNEGEFWAVKQSIFEATYEEVND